MQFTLDDLTERLQEALADAEPLPGSLLLIVSSLGLIHVTGDTVTNFHQAAECMLWINDEHFYEWLSGGLSTDDALSSGKLGIMGDLGIAAAAEPIFTKAWALRGQPVRH
jgi:hypothetical protein